MSSPLTALATGAGIIASPAAFGLARRGEDCQVFHGPATDPAPASALPVILAAGEAHHARGPFSALEGVLA